LAEQVTPFLAVNFNEATVPLKPEREGERKGKREGWMGGSAGRVGREGREGGR